MNVFFISKVLLISHIFINFGKGKFKDKSIDIYQDNGLSELLLLLAGGKIDKKAHKSENRNEPDILLSESIEKNTKNEKNIDNDRNVMEIDSIDEILTVKGSNHSAVHIALSVLLGEKPSEENKLSLEQITAIIELDELLQEQERKEEANLDKLFTKGGISSIEDPHRSKQIASLSKTLPSQNKELSKESSKKSVEIIKEIEPMMQQQKKSIDSTMDNALRKMLQLLTGSQIEKIENEPEFDNSNESKHEDHGAVKEALSALLGENPSEEEKLTVEELAVIIKLDAYLQEEERNENARVEKMENLVEKAISFIDGAVTLREKVEKTLIGEDLIDDYDYYTYEDFLANVDISPSELRELVENTGK